MLQKSPPLRRFTYRGLPDVGLERPQTCVIILEGFGPGRLQPLLAFPRAQAHVLSRSRQNPGFCVEPPLYYAVTFPRWPQSALQSCFIRLPDRADSATSATYCWPTPVAVVEYAKARGIMTVRKMINTPQSTVERISDCAYSPIGLPIGHTIDAAAVEAERRELALYDWNCGPSALLEASLVKGGVSRDKLISASFGWSPARSAREVEKRHNWEVASYA